MKMHHDGLFWLEPTWRLKAAWGKPWWSVNFKIVDGFVMAGGGGGGGRGAERTDGFKQVLPSDVDT